MTEPEQISREERQHIITPSCVTGIKPRRRQTATAAKGAAGAMRTSAPHQQLILPKKISEGRKICRGPVSFSRCDYTLMFPDFHADLITSPTVSYDFPVGEKRGEMFNHVD